MEVDMVTHMVRKQICITARQQDLLKWLAEERGLSESEIIRQAIDRELSGEFAFCDKGNHSAWEEIVAFLDARRVIVASGKPYHCNRDEIYAEREDRWLLKNDAE